MGGGNEGHRERQASKRQQQRGGEKKDNGGDEWNEKMLYLHTFTGLRNGCLGLSESILNIMYGRTLKKYDTQNQRLCRVLSDLKLTLFSVSSVVLLYMLSPQNLFHYVTPVNKCHYFFLSISDFIHAVCVSQQPLKLQLFLCSVWLC